MFDFVIKKGDRLPVLRVEFSDENGVIDLTGCSISFKYRIRTGTTTTSRAMAIEDADAGTAYYQWVTGDVSDIGVFIGEFVVTDVNSMERSFPLDGYVVFEILEEI